MSHNFVYHGEDEFFSPTPTYPDGQRPIPGIIFQKLQPLPFGSKIGAMGDSIVDRNHDPQTVSSGEMSTNIKGALAMALLMDRRFDFYAVYDPLANPVYNNRSGCNWGESGQTTAQMQSRITQLSAMSPRPAVGYFRCAVNDIILTTDDAPTIMGRIDSMISTCKAAGIGYFILNTIAAAAHVELGLTYGLTAAQQTRLLAVNDLIRDYCVANPNVILSDIYYTYAQGDGFGNVSLLVDGLHPNQLGTFYEVRDHLLPAIRKLIRPGIYLPDLSANLYPFSFSSFTSQALLNGVSGNVPTGMRVLRSSASGSTTCITSKVTEDGIDKLQLAFTPGGTGYETFMVEPLASAFQTINVPNPGWIRLGFFVEVPSTYDFGGMSPLMYITNTSSVFGWGNKGGSSPLGQWYAGAKWHVTEALPVSGAATANVLPRYMISIQGDFAGVPPVVKLSQPFIVAVPDPRLH